MKQLRCEQVKLLGSFVRVKGMTSERNVYELWLRENWRNDHGHGFQSRWRYLKIFRCTYQAITEIVQQMWGSFHQMLCSVLRISLFPILCLPFQLRKSVPSELQMVSFGPKMMRRIIACNITLSTKYLTSTKTKTWKRSRTKERLDPVRVLVC